MTFPLSGAATNRRHLLDRRTLERRAPKPGVNVRYEDKDDPSRSKRVRRGRKEIR